MHEDTKISLILGRPFLSTARAKIDVFKRKISFRIGDDKVVFKNDEIVSYTIASLYAVEAFDGFMNVQDDIMEEVVLPNISLDHNVNLSHISPFQNFTVFDDDEGEVINEREDYEASENEIPTKLEIEGNHIDLGDYIGEGLT